MVSKSMAGLSYIEPAHASNPLPLWQAASRRFVYLFTLIIALWMGATSMAWAQSDTKTVHLVALGDSLTAGYGLNPRDGFTAQLQAALTAKGHRVRVHNGGVSGDTSAGGLARLDWAVGPRSASGDCRAGCQ